MSRWSRAWLGLAVKTDGAAVAAGGITDSLIVAKAAAEGIHYQPGWILATTATVKVFIDVFIGVWAFILAYIWTNHVNVAAGGEKAKLSEIWQRFPKFILGFIATFAIGLTLALARDAQSLAETHRRHRRGQCVPGHFLHPDFLLDRRAVEFPQIVGGRTRQTGGGLFRLAVRLRHLGRAADFLAVFRRRQTAAGRLRRDKQMSQEDLKAEINNAVEPLLPIEKKLIGWSLGTGVFLLAVLLLLGHYFPVS